ncbi:MAG: hypothetical protein ACE5JQ_14760 [Candidatus Methylomirabilales bacterium]
MKKVWALIVTYEPFRFLVICLALFGLMYLLASMLERGFLQAMLLVVWVFALIGVVGFGAQVLWAVVSWASLLNEETPADERRIKHWVLAAALVIPPVLLARPDMDFQAILRSVTSLYFIGAAVVVGWLARTFSGLRRFPRVKTYFIVYATVVVLMGLGGLGVFRSADDEYDYTEEESEIASPLTTRELVLRNIIFYSIAGFVGVYSTRRKDDPI